MPLVGTLDNLWPKRCELLKEYHRGVDIRHDIFESCCFTTLSPITESTDKAVQRNQMLVKRNESRSGDASDELIALPGRDMICQKRESEHDLRG